MTFVVTDACIDVLDRSCLEECPVDCIYEGDRKMYVNPVECIDCGACEQACPTGAAVADRLIAGTDAAWNTTDNAAFFDSVLPGRTTPLGTPGGATHLGPVGVDTPTVAALPHAEPPEESRDHHRDPITRRHRSADRPGPPGGGRRDHPRRGPRDRRRRTRGRAALSPGAPATAAHACSAPSPMRWRQPASRIVETADAETALGATRLHGELNRTGYQFRFFAEVLVDGGYLEATIDHAGRHPMGPRPDLRRMLVPIGPVAVFGASNFPLAFSVPGGDTASALAAGSPVVVKAHGSHPATSQLVLRGHGRGAPAAGAPEGTLGIVYGRAAGSAWSRTRRSGRSASPAPWAAARALLEIIDAATRPDPVLRRVEQPQPRGGDRGSGRRARPRDRRRAGRRP